MMQENSNGVPNNLPIGQPPQPQSSLPNEPEDILESIDAAEPAVRQPDTAAKMPSARPMMPAAPVAPKLPPAVAPAPRAQTKEPILNRGKRAIMLAIVLILVLGVLGVAAWYAYGIFFNPSAEVPQVNTNAATPQNDQTSQQPAVNANPEPVQPKDTDRDGLSDQDEELYGTDINNVDTDADGLTDRDEIRVFETDPNVADTDADGFTDGEEVRNGYDPKGPGKLLEIR